jgi:hypothetical protein
LQPKGTPLVAGELVSYVLTMTDQVPSQRHLQRKQAGIAVVLGKNCIDNVCRKHIGIAKFTQNPTEIAGSLIDVT